MSIMMVLMMMMMVTDGHLATDGYWVANRPSQALPLAMQEAAQKLVTREPLSYDRAR